MRKRTTKKKTLKPGTRRIKGRVVPKKGYRFKKNGGGSTVKVRKRA